MGAESQSDTSPIVTDSGQTCTTGDTRHAGKVGERSGNGGFKSSFVSLGANGEISLVQLIITN